MAGPWDKYGSQDQQQAAPEEGGSLQARPAGAPSKAFTGAILPFSAGEDGRLRFDSNAGLIGGLKRQITTTGDALSGKLDLSTEEGFERVLEMATLAAPVPPGIRAGRLGSAPPKVRAPTSKKLRAAADQGFKAVEDMGVDYTTPSVSKMIGRVRGALEEEGLFAEAAPITHGILRKFDYPPEGSFVGIAALEAAKKAARRAATRNAQEKDAASKLINEIDQYIMAADPKGLGPGLLVAPQRNLRQPLRTGLLTSDPMPLPASKSAPTFAVPSTRPVPASMWSTAREFTMSSWTR
ncbi:hypothetical protein [Bosea sp. 2RAB26]|uniref:hypothetical protein n=1 Tax=Bosea sp. 2RAB26 TaxID=3237476 RepID=UPI003F8FDC6C